MAMIRCTSCGYEIPPEVFQGREEAPCPLCRRQVTAIVLPAISRGGAPPPPLPDIPAGPGDTVCFYDPEKRAVKSCAHCGVFISESWSAHWGTETVCLKCLEDLRSRRKDVRFESKRVLWDNIALTSASAPFLLCLPLMLLGPVGVPFMILCVLLSVITAPLGLGLAVYSWRKPRSLAPRGKWRAAGAGLLSVAQCGAWIALIVALIERNI